MVIGCALGGLATNKWDPHLVPAGPLIQVDLDQSVIGRSFPITLGMVAEAGAMIDGLCALGQDGQPDAPAVAERRAFIEALKASRSPFAEPQKRDSEAAPILPQALMACLNSLLPAGSHLFVDSANCVGWSMHYLAIDPPSQIHSSLGMGPMGVAVAGVIGAKLGAPDRTCVAIVGDGAFLMHGNEVSTAAQYGVGAIWIVLDDNDLAMVSQGMNQVFGGPDPSFWHDYYQIGAPDLVCFAQALGADAYSVHSPEDMRQAFPLAIERAREERRPQVIVAHIDTSEVPPYYPKS
jgi:acetolactate synthase-1/2/3 large subunit